MGYTQFFCEMKRLACDVSIYVVFVVILCMVLLYRLARTGIIRIAEVGSQSVGWSRLYAVGPGTDEDAWVHGLISLHVGSKCVRRRGLCRHGPLSVEESEVRSTVYRLIERFIDSQTDITKNTRDIYYATSIERLYIILC
jgi:hypothetical protein